MKKSIRITEKDHDYITSLIDKNGSIEMRLKESILETIIKYYKDSHEALLEK